MVTQAQATAFACSNRTFMELKLKIRLSDTALSVSSNRTFMELKFADNVNRSNPSFVLIAPLWN